MRKTEKFKVKSRISSRVKKMKRICRKHYINSMKNMSRNREKRNCCK